jgi:hypothetical protein
MELAATRGDMIFRVSASAAGLQPSVVAEVDCLGTLADLAAWVLAALEGKKPVRRSIDR